MNFGTAVTSAVTFKCHLNAHLYSCAAFADGSGIALYYNFTVLHHLCTHVWQLMQKNSRVVAESFLQMLH